MCWVVFKSERWNLYGVNPTTFMDMKEASPSQRYEIEKCGDLASKMVQINELELYDRQEVTNPPEPIRISVL
ncbi:MAG: hypothetical protein COY66_05065 [Candidatus Kerfeldbacteria bacterium CG_4_10_14_0_8_um_filter_42_10]|uniref:Uncharacterized protein n=1 Tax=Candidatus Kerfeldbacteria bacterium CG_4_10_14_0_8_um_filter_42_10 TaxID=2014248 RepID=A0A2M7RI90_9BACT|nr:MAG: hypothetical protein COY66_05065 [Candidatus Kerfeldbacteria bacterium CG_4_10_14_0_8_um_filter_42_10]